MTLSGELGRISFTSWYSSCSASVEFIILVTLLLDHVCFYKYSVILLFFPWMIREKPVRKIWWPSQGIPALKFCRPNGNHPENTAILACKQNFYNVRIHAKVVTFSRGRYDWRAFIFRIKRVFWCFARLQSDRNQKVKHDILHDLTDQKIQLLRES